MNPLGISFLKIMKFTLVLAGSFELPISYLKNLPIINDYFYCVSDSGILKSSYEKCGMNILCTCVTLSN